ncbi:hypothetical protein J6TS1_08080 [Siminovitchia terrae]|uniref:Uncharacterized protein n=1 Tax=Siminovitchia terrae TaxID=1914933 RepID=A0ABQ4KSC5_SIMTE|nr:hypothetical protein J6TS1_08080 [Siminovitchia terrae]
MSKITFTPREIKTLQNSRYSEGSQIFINKIGELTEAKRRRKSESRIRRNRTRSPLVRLSKVEP